MINSVVIGLVYYDIDDYFNHLKKYEIKSQLKLWTMTFKNENWL
jgi:hypothetical protein